MHQPGPDAKHPSIHRQNVVTIGDLVEPSFNFVRLGGILFAGDLDARLNFANGDGGKIQIGIIYSLDPRQHSCVGAPRRNSETTFVSSKYIRLIRWEGLATAPPATLRNGDVASALSRQ